MKIGRLVHLFYTILKKFELKYYL